MKSMIHSSWHAFHVLEHKEQYATYGALLDGFFEIFYVVILIPLSISRPTPRSCRTRRETSTGGLYHYGAYTT